MLCPHLNGVKQNKDLDPSDTDLGGDTRAINVSQFTHTETSIRCRQNAPIEKCEGLRDLQYLQSDVQSAIGASSSWGPMLLERLFKQLLLCRV